jgi:hypothetical protein
MLEQRNEKYLSLDTLRPYLADRLLGMAEREARKRLIVLDLGCHLLTIILIDIPLIAVSV